jgi:hypothetical protein
MDKPILSIANGAWLFALLLGAPVQGAPFNEQMRAPPASAPQLQEQLHRHFRTVEEKRAKGDEALLRDPVEHQRAVDLEFTIGRRLDEGQPLGDEAELAKFGLMKRPDGSYAVDTKKFPQWKSLDRQLLWFANEEALEGFLPALQARGFRPDDVDALREYVRTHDVQAMMFPEQKELVQTFAQRAATAGKEDVLAFVHQGNRLRREYERRWAVGLLDALSPQSRRALTSYLLEEWPEERVIGAPENTVDAHVAETLSLFHSGEYQRQLDKQEAELSRRAQQ